MTGDDSALRRRMRAAKMAHGDAADRPSDLRRALADLGRVIGDPLPDPAGPAPAGP